MSEVNRSGERACLWRLLQLEAMQPRRPAASPIRVASSPGLGLMPCPRGAPYEFSSDGTAISSASTGAGSCTRDMNAEH